MKHTHVVRTWWKFWRWHFHTDEYTTYVRGRSTRCEVVFRGPFITRHEPGRIA